MATGTEDDYKQEVEKIWSTYDGDGSGSLNKEEACQLLKDFIGDLTGEVPDEDELENKFHAMDLDQSGDIDKEEAVRFLKGYRAGVQLKQMMAMPIQIGGSM